MFADLPPEILQQIIKYNLSGDLQSLRSCSLVCWRWRHATLPTLMAKVVVRYRRQVSADDVLDSVPFLARYMRHLVVSTASCTLKSLLETTEANSLFCALIVALPYFTRVSRMTLTDDAMFSVLTIHPQAKLSNISHFTVYRAGEDLPIRIIRAFPHLRVLHFIGVSLDFHDIIDDLTSDPTGTQTPIPIIEELALQLAPGPFEIFMKWASHTKTLDFSQLKTLKISISDGERETSRFTKQLVPLVVGPTYKLWTFTSTVSLFKLK